MSAVTGQLLASLDMSGNTARFALAENDGQVICRTRKPMRQREAAGLADFIFESLQCAGRQIDEVGFWSIGSGPGSFTGMRLAAALICGFSRRNNVQVRCVPTACAVADSLDIADGATVTVLFDGRNREIIAYETHREPSGSVPTGKCEVLNAARAEKYFLENTGRVFVTQKSELEAVLKMVPEDVQLVVVEEFDPAKLISAVFKEYDGDFAALEYIRPAVFTQQ